MPQAILPMFSKDMIVVSRYIGVEQKNDIVYWSQGCIPMFQHHVADMDSFHNVCCQMINLGTASAAELGRALGINREKLSRWARLENKSMRTFVKVKPLKKRKKKSTVLTPDVIANIQNLYCEGNTIMEISEAIGVPYSTIKKGIARGCIILAYPVPSSSISTASSRSQEDAHQQMGKACQNVVERTSKGGMNCPVEFENQVDLQYAGLLITIPALIACGILKGISRFDLSKVYYTTTQIFLSLAFMVMLRVKQLEQSKLLSCGELGRCLGMDRTPSVQTLRNRLNDFTALSDVQQWSLELSRDWMKQDAIDGVLYVDGHVNIYYGKNVDMPKRYVSRMRLCFSGCTDYWVNGALGEPYFVVHKTINVGIIKTLFDDIIPELDKSVPNQPTKEQLEENPLQHRYMLVLDRECYSVSFFIELKKRRIAFCTYRKNVKNKWDISEFQEYTVKNKSGETVCLKLAERSTYLTTRKKKGKPVEGIVVREIRKLCPSGHQTAIITTNFSMSITDIGLNMFARWNQENYFKYAIESFGIDHLISNVKKSIQGTYTIPNPEYKAINQEYKSISGKLAKQVQKLGEITIKIQNMQETEDKLMTKYLQQKAEIYETVKLYEAEKEAVKQKKKEIPERIDIREANPDKEIFTAINDQKQLMDTIKMIGYWAETALVNQIKHLMTNPEEARTLMRSIYQSNADLKVDKQNNRLYVLLHHSNFASTDTIIRKLFEVLNKTETVFPGSDLTLYYKLVSD